MNKFNINNLKLVLYLILSFLVILIDRVTKYIAFNYLNLSQYTINKFISFELVINRGISWGILNSSNFLIFSALTLLVIFITLYLTCYSIFRFKQNYLIIGEILVLAGSVSNIFDRFIYGGVIDFIAINFNSFSNFSSFGYWNFPIFNIADSAISLGIFIMLMQFLKKEPNTVNYSKTG